MSNDILHNICGKTYQIVSIIVEHDRLQLMLLNNPLIFRKEL